ncbi:MAG: cysteine methyltransferase [Candidatus Omnitrophota bacterium]|jgi:putative addiction module component (TIGR02574 family)|nr:MAG: cysteine methyltransferase [Candidatus Omnitrophota bacterium]
MMQQTLIKEISKLSQNEKLLLVEAIWDSIAEAEGEVEIPDHHKEIIANRLETLDQDKEQSTSWDELRTKYL